MRSDAAADSGPAAECSSTGASMVAPALGNGCCCTRGDRPAERAPAPAGAGTANKGRPISGGLVWSWPPPPLDKVPFIGHFLVSWGDNKGGNAPFTPRWRCPLYVVVLNLVRFYPLWFPVFTTLRFGLFSGFYYLTFRAVLLYPIPLDAAGQRIPSMQRPRAAYCF